MIELFTYGPSFWRHKPEFGKEKEIEISNEKFSTLIKYKYFYLRKGNIKCPYGLYFTIQIKKNISQCHAILQIRKEEIIDLFFKNTNVVYDEEKWNDPLRFNYWQNIVLFLHYSHFLTDTVYFDYRIKREQYLAHLQKAAKKLLEKAEKFVEENTITSINTEKVERTYQFTIF